MAPISPRPRAFLVGLALVLFAATASAHESRVPVAADAFGLETLISNSLIVTITDQDAILVTHDPRTTDSGLFVYGTGENGGGTGLIDLAPGFWSEIRESGVLVGYSYDDPAGTRGGITHVTYRSRQLEVVGGGTNFTWKPSGPQDEVWFHFVMGEEFLCAEFDATSADELANEANSVRFSDSDPPVECPAQVCGNGIRELPEVCDDGNLESGDGCSATCDSVECDSPEFDSTYDGIQQIIFSSPVYGCDNQLCHNNAVTPAKGGLDLTPGKSYDALIHKVSSSPFFTISDGGVKVDFLERVVPGEAPVSMLFQVLEAKTNGNPHNVPAMPSNSGPLLDDHVAAIERWIRGGAPRDLVVEGTAGLLGACLPEEDPLKLAEPPMPPKGKALQLRQTGWDLPHGSEDEICMATWYDFTKTDLVPASAQRDCPEFEKTNNPSGKCFAYNRRVLLQDGQSHHSIIQIYNGTQALLANGPAGQQDRKFGPFTYKPNGLDDPKRGLTCDPKAIDPATGFAKDCSGVVVSGATCTGYGPVDVFQAPAFAGSQEPYVDNTEPEGVYSILPMSGVVIWNSHAFNLTTKDTTMAQYLDVYFAKREQQLYRQQGIFDIGKIYIQQVPPFQKREYCKTYTVPADALVYELGSHTHRWGTKFRIWGPPNDVCYPGDTGGILAGNAFTCEPKCTCGPGDPDQLLYFSTEYTDPVQLAIDPPMSFGESVEDRTFLFCSEYDNGSTPTSPPVKQQSLSPEPPDFEFAGLNLRIGGPCPKTDTTWLGQFPLHGVSCMDGPKKGLACGTKVAASFCETSPGEGDGVCDACEVMGGFTTADEMFILLGSWYDGSETPVFIPVIESITPNSGTQGDTLEVILVGGNTTFTSASAVDFGPGVDVLSTTVDSTTAIRVEIAIALDAPVGMVDVSVSTDASTSLSLSRSEAAESRSEAAEVAVLVAGFQILEKPFEPLPADGNVEGCVPAGGTFYEFESNGMENLSFSITGRKGDGGPIVPTVSMIDSGGAQQLLAIAKKPGKPATAKNIPILAAGTYLLLVADADGEAGCFDGSIRVRGDGPGGRSRGPDDAGASEGITGRWKIEDCIEDGEEFTIPFMPKQGSKLGLKIRGVAGDGQGALAPKASLETPGGDVRVLGENSSKLRINGVPLILGGEYEVKLESKDADGGGCFEAELAIE